MHFHPDMRWAAFRHFARQLQIRPCAESAISFVAQMPSSVESRRALGFRIKACHLRNADQAPASGISASVLGLALLPNSSAEQGCVA